MPGGIFSQDFEFELVNSTNNSQRNSKMFFISTPTRKDTPKTDTKTTFSPTENPSCSTENLSKNKNLKKSIISKVFFRKMSPVSRIVPKILRSPLCSQNLWALVKIEGYCSILRFLLEPKGFASIEDSLGFSALCDLPETFFEKKLSKLLIFSDFCFLRGFRLSKMGFQLGRKWFSCQS